MGIHPIAFVTMIAGFIRASSLVYVEIDATRRARYQQARAHDLGILTESEFNFRPRPRAPFMGAPDRCPELLPAGDSALWVVC